jgi:hypothetical protein
MSIPVNPPPYSRIPARFANDAELRPYFESLRTILYQLWQRTGGSSDAIEALQADEPFDAGISGASFINLLEEFENTDAISDHYRPLHPATEAVPVVSVSSAYTTTGSAVIIATAALTITLNASPDDQEEVAIQRATTAGPVVVSGTINGDTSYHMVGNYESKVFRYVLASAEWIIL